MHQGGFIFFRPMVQRLLNFEYFCHLKFNKFAKKLILIVRLLCSMQGDDEIVGGVGEGGKEGGGRSHKTINFGGKLSFILSFLFPERRYH
jgi:hypothetical protein